MVKATKEEMEGEQHFANNFSRLPSSEYSVRLPLKRSAELLGESYGQAYRRFLSLERKLGRYLHLKEQYSAFFKEFLDLKHMSLVSPELSGCCKYFLPHHCVLKVDSTTAKLRVVFDGSAMTGSGNFLNDVLMARPLMSVMHFQLDEVAEAKEKIRQTARILSRGNFKCSVYMP
ncbi:uncharacterized protein LOC135438813 [Drosophila montana]|uniref:uncharacterized protein LOC135438813 n=1 Tax=Drosophila montana TaxID=40370 RepID=UPI00313BC817